jgi:protein-L-isoaspartate(D-aspartate) O-methyltransferase
MMPTNGGHGLAAPSIDSLAVQQLCGRAALGSVATRCIVGLPLLATTPARTMTNALVQPKSANHGSSLPARKHFSRMLRSALMAIVMVCSVARAAAAASDERELASNRRAMVAEIRAYASTVGSIAGREGISEAVLAALDRIPRHQFVPPAERPNAYENRPLPIGYGQTISQPYIVALMTDLLDVEASDIVLEIGTGSGYQAAILGTLARKVFTIEIVPELAQTASERLARMGHDNVTVKTGDGYYGWAEHGPFDAIMVTAAASHIPPPLLRQLKPSGRMLVPVGGPFLVQNLVLITKDENGEIRTRNLLPVRFVPLVGKH